VRASVRLIDRWRVTLDRFGSRGDRISEARQEKSNRERMHVAGQKGGKCVGMVVR
jgi:hypothetical protein